MRGYLLKLSVVTLSNTPQLQAVQHKGLGLTGIAFYKAGTVETKTGLSISVNKPCLLMVQEKENKIQISASNPENKPLTVDVDINRKLAGQGCVWLEQSNASRITFNLPDGQDAGKTVVRLLECAN
jgi:chondroitin AC lyase